MAQGVSEADDLVTQKRVGGQEPGRVRDGITLRFRDLPTENQAADLAATEYTFQVRGPCANSDRQVTAFPAIYLSGEALAAAAECGSAGDLVEVSIWPKRGQELSKPVRISFDRASTRIQRISRG